MGNHAEKARDFFLQGYNCAQSVACAYAEDMGVSIQQAARMASSFGGGLGKMREVCGAVSGAALVYGILRGYDDPEDQIAKAQHYARVQQLCLQFKEKYNTLLCRDLLEGIEIKNKDSSEPDPRTPEYYKVRPCARFVETAAQILENMLCT